MALNFPIKAQTWHHGSTRVPSTTQAAEDADGSHISRRWHDLCHYRARRSLTKKKKCSCTQVSQKCPRTLHVFHHWFLALHVLTHWFPTVQPLVLIPSGVQSLNHLSGLSLTQKKKSVQNGVISKEPADSTCLHPGVPNCSTMSP